MRVHLGILVNSILQIPELLLENYIFSGRKICSFCHLWFLEFFLIFHPACSKVSLLSSSSTWKTFTNFRRFSFSRKSSYFFFCTLSISLLHLSSERKQRYQFSLDFILLLTHCFYIDFFIFYSMNSNNEERSENTKFRLFQLIFISFLSSVEINTEFRNDSNKVFSYQAFFIWERIF